MHYLAIEFEKVHHDRQTEVVQHGMTEEMRRRKQTGPCSIRLTNIDTVNGCY